LAGAINEPNVSDRSEIVIIEVFFILKI
jgi:hypothetical protein